MLKKQNGITLIALIITIIVMLILVGVTINVALNGGLFEKAEIATNETKKALEKEELIQIVVGEYNHKDKIANADNIKTKAGTNYTEDTTKSKAGQTLVFKGKSGTFWEINLKSLEVKEYEDQTDEPESEWYIGNVTSTAKAKLHKTTGELVVEGTGAISGYYNSETTLHANIVYYIIKDMEKDFTSDETIDALVSQVITGGLDESYLSQYLSSYSYDEQTIQSATDLASSIVKVSSLSIDTGITEIGEEACYMIRNLTNISISDTVTKIGANAFYYTKISYIEIPSSVSEIDNSAFASNKSTLKNIKVNRNLEDAEATLGTGWILSGVTVEYNDTTKTY